MRYLAKEPLLFEPGDRWEYSLCHDVLAALVEVVSGTRFSEYVKGHIFDVLGMNSSTYCLPECEINKISVFYAQHMHGSQYDRSVIYAEVLKTINNYL